MRTLFFITLSSAVVLAQAPAPARAPVPARGAVRIVAAPGSSAVQVAPGASTVQFISAANIGPTIAGAPYSAEAVNETIQTLADGNRIVERTSTKQYRDSQGRERRELGDLIVISDPVAKVRYNLHPQTKTADKMSEQGDFFFVPFEGNRIITAPTAAGLHSTTFAFTRRVEAGTALQGTFGFPQVVDSGAAGPIELLPARNIEGVIANGTKTVRTIPAGTIGNERPIEVVDENWTSPELGVTVLTAHSDPRSGTTTYKLTNINRSEPPRSLFEVPADYTLVESPLNLIRKKEE